MSDGRLSRRDFLRDSALAAAGVAAGIGAAGRRAARAADLPPEVRKTRAYNPAMAYRRLGKTGLWVSAVCLGGHWKGMQRVLKGPVPGLGSFVSGPGAEALLQNRRDVITRCIEVGINFVDACTMGEVSAYGPALKGRREQMYMGFAMWPRCPRDRRNTATAKAMLQALDDGMTAAQVDYVDVYRLVADERGSRHTPTEVDEMIAALDAAKKAGKARFTGVSSHDRTWLKMLIEKYPGQIEVVLFPYTAASMELPTDSLFDAVRRHDVGTFGIKPFGSGSLLGKGKTQEERDRIAREAIRYILANPAMTAPIPGLASPAEVDNMALAVKEGAGLAAHEKAELRRAAAYMLANLPPEYTWLKDWQYV
jgi:aryl-alcohol dehydrogenase-like predicted oxidoreductase